jgi:CRP-like cAMP-binding protein
MTYNKFDAGKVVLKQGHPPGSFYFVLSGTLEVIKREQDEITKQYHENVIMNLNADQVFGELALLDGSPRLASVVCKTTVELLTVDGDAYRRILDSVARKEAELKEKIATTIPLFATFNCELKKVGAVCHLKEFQPNQPILVEGEYSDKLFFIIQGSCKTIKMCKFRQRTNHTTGETRILRYKEDQVLRSDEEVVTKLLVVGTLEKGQYFGLGNLYSSGKRYALKEVIESKKTREDTSTVAISKVQCLVLSRVDFLRFISDNTVEYINDNDLYNNKRGRYHFIEDAYLKNMTWTICKAKYLQSKVKEFMQHKRERVMPIQQPVSFV